MKETKIYSKLYTVIKSLVYASVCLALAMVLPFLTGQIPQVGATLCPMHLPVLLCGFLCGPFWAAVVGLTAPPLRFFLFGMPPFPTNVAMACELAAYGLVSGLLYTKLPKTKKSIYVSLLAAMLLGRIVWGIVRALLSGVFGTPLTFALFWASAFTNAIPGIICHIILIPILVMALRRAKIM